MPNADTPVADLPDAVLVGAHDLALAALKESTPAQTIGAAVGHRADAAGTVSLLFANTMLGYPGWFWTVTVGRVEDGAPTVLEIELLPGEGSLLAPEWVPWAERLADYHAQQATLAAESAAAKVDSESDDDESDDDESDDDDDIDDDDDDDDDDLDDEPASILHSGDVDGVDIDELDDSVTSDDEDESEDDESDDDESGDDASDDDAADAQGADGIADEESSSR